MLTDETIDEDLEALLYAQVYYGKSNDPMTNENENDVNILASSDSNNSQAVEPEVVNNRRKNPTRYFANKQTTQVNRLYNIDSGRSSGQETVRNSPIGQSILMVQNSDQNKTQSYGEINPSPTPSNRYEGSYVDRQLQSYQPSPSYMNNIIINQYIYPSKKFEEFQKKLDYYQEKLPWNRPCRRFLRNLQEGKLTENRFFKIMQKRLHKYLLRTKQNQPTPVEVICLNSSDDSDVEIVDVNVTPKNTSETSAAPATIDKGSIDKMEKEEKLEENDESDEIIYIPPPPVPIINLDESDSENADHSNGKIATEATQKLPQDIDDASNDFLANEANCSTENFNFSLHGSEFQNSDFARPINPTDVYETESSTSTSEFKDTSRNFSNTVKTIVFSEVEFPKDDVFTENNLEKFGEMITPKRPDRLEKHKSDDSSESDCSTSDAHQNLPALTPINNEHSINNRNLTESLDAKSTQSSNKKRNIGQIEIPVTPKVKSKKRKKSSKTDLNNPNTTINNEDWQVSASSTPKTKEKGDSIKKKKRVSKKKSEKNKLKSGSKNYDATDNNEHLYYSADTQFDAQSETVANSLMDTEEHTKKKSKKRKSKSIDGTLFDTQKIELSKMSQEENNANLSNNEETVKINVTQEDEVPKEFQNYLGGNDDTEEIDSSTRKRNKKKKQKLSETCLSTEVQPKDMDFEYSQSTVVNTTISIQNQECNRDELISTPTVEKELVGGSVTGVNDNEGEHLKEPEKNTCIDESPQPFISLYEQELLENSSTYLPNQEELADNVNASVSVPDSNKKEGHNPTNEKNVIEIQDDHTSLDFTNEPSPVLKICRSYNTESSDQREAVGESVNYRINADDYIIIDEVESVSSKEVFVIDSDSNDDIQTFEGLGDNLQLANTSRDVYTEFKEFDIEFLHRKMSNDPSKWEILPTDKFRSPIYSNGPRCNRCRQRGHVGIKCPNRPALPNCSLCGHSGHYEPRCPNKICFTCGNPGNFSTVCCFKCVKNLRETCPICTIHGHTSSHCPDLWRRYHLTTEDGPIVKPPYKSEFKPRYRQWCSGCASQGHLEFECNSYRWNREYPATSTQIFSYDDVYPNRRASESPRRQSGGREQSFTESDHTARTRLSDNINSSQNIVGDGGANQSLVTSTKSRRKSGKKPKLNPLSIIDNQNKSPSSFKHYESVWNPYSVFNSNISKSDQNASASNQMNIQPTDDFIPLEYPQLFGCTSENNCNTESTNKNHKPNMVEPSIIHRFKTCPMPTLKRFIDGELNRLSEVDMDAKLYKKKVYLIENLNKIAIKNKSIKKQLYSLYKKLNMFLFGVTFLGDGKRHLDYLKNFLYNYETGDLKPAKRESLLDAYSYIFGGKHYNFNYKHHLNNAMFRRYRN
ncbi:zinc finger CCHC-type containing 7 [Rhynchophorus ferrugineus]|uniref:zinc finger CCHC-type containing 7 n=1 Tax=Rhynchophorus ferrugineus TaxID=354439 RepID=UPI003FCC5D23